MLKGDTKPLEVLYKRHYELLLNFGLKYVSDEEFVKDCIQDLFVKLCSSTRLSPTDYVRSYLLTSLKNLIFDKLSSLKSTEDINALPFDLTIEDTSLEVLFKDNDEDIQMIKICKRLINNCPRINGWRFIFVTLKAYPIEKLQLSWRLILNLP